MILKRTFIWSPDERRGGTDGWIPAWIKHEGFDPGWGLGVAHDTFEHRTCDNGSWPQEIMAFGAMLYIRGLSGYFTHLHGEPVGFFMGKEAGELWIDAGKPKLFEPAPMRGIRRARLDDDFFVEAPEFVEGMLHGIEIYGGSDALEECDEEWRAMTGRLLIEGGAQAMHRYRKHSPAHLCWMFEQLEEKVDAITRRGDFLHGDRMHVTVDIGNDDIRIRTPQADRREW